MIPSAPPLCVNSHHLLRVRIGSNKFRLVLVDSHICTSFIQTNEKVPVLTLIGYCIICWDSQIIETKYFCENISMQLHKSQHSRVMYLQELLVMYYLKMTNILKWIFAFLQQRFYWNKNKTVPWQVTDGLMKSNGYWRQHLARFENKKIFVNL